MIIYTDEDKELVIPKGLGNIDGGSDYDSGYQDGYQNGYAIGTSEGYNRAIGDIRNNATVLNVTNNGQYSANTEDSIYFKQVNVNVAVDPSAWYTSGYTDGYAVGFQAGLAEGFESGYQSGSTDGYALGMAVQKAKLISTAVTVNGTYSREDGFSSIEVNIPSDWEGGYQSGHTDGYAEGTSDGYNQAIGDVRNNAITLNVTENGEYSADTESSVYFKQVNVNVAAPEMLNKSEQMTATTQTFLPEMPRPNANGRYVYGGLLEDFKAVMSQYIDVRIMTWDDAGHSDWTLLGSFGIIEETGEAGYIGGSYNTPFTSCTTQWTQVDEYWNTKVWVYYDGYDVFFNIQGNFRYGYALASAGGYIFTDDELTFPTKAYYGMSAITVDASNVFNSGYTSGSTEAVDNWYEGFLGGMFTSVHTYPSGATVIYLEDHTLKFPNKSLRASGTAEVTGSVIVSNTTKLTSEAPDWGFSYIRGGSFSNWTTLISLDGQTIPVGTYEYKYNVSFGKDWFYPKQLKPDGQCGFLCDSNNWSQPSPQYTSAGNILTRTFYFE